MLLAYRFRIHIKQISCGKSARLTTIAKDTSDKNIPDKNLDSQNAAHGGKYMDLAHDGQLKLKVQEKSVTTQRKKSSARPGGKTHTTSRWTRKYAILIIAFISLIVAVGTVAVIIYMGLTTRTNPSLQRQSHMKWQDQQFEPPTPSDLTDRKNEILKKP